LVGPPGLEPGTKGFKSMIKHIVLNNFYLEENEAAIYKPKFQ